MTEKDFWVFLNGRLARGRVNQLSAVTGSDVPLLAEAGKFLGGHAFLPRDYDKIPREDIAAMSELLLGGDAGIFTKEAIIMILAHHPSRDALDCLVRYNRCPDERLKIFAEFALDECRWWNSK